MKKKTTKNSSKKTTKNKPIVSLPPLSVHSLPPELLSGVVRIDVVGAGGSGSQMLNGLARLHLALRSLGHSGFQVFLCDPDEVTESNIGRQLFSPADIGRYKAEVLIERVNAFFGLQWRAYPAKWGANTGFGERHPEILITCTDTRSSRRFVHKELLRRQEASYWLDVGNLAATGQVILGQVPNNDHEAGLTNKADWQPRQLPLVTELFPEILTRKAKESNTPSCSLAEALRHQDLFVNQAVTTWALHLLWTFFRKGHIRHHGYFINLESGHVRPIPVPPLPAKPKAK